MFKKGDYVRVRMAPDALLGTVEGTDGEGKTTRYLFRRDQRFYSRAEPIDLPFREDELEICTRPTDSEIEALNQKIKRGS